jgi:hypothetical protein
MTTLAASQKALSTNEIAELDRRWAAIEAGKATVSNDTVVRWLRTRGTPAFKSWMNREARIVGGGARGSRSM